MLIVSGTKPDKDKFHYVHHYKSGSQLRIRIIEELKHNDYYFKYKGEIKGVERVKTRGSVLIRIIRNKNSRVRPLDEELVTFQSLSEFNGAMNPGAFDFKGYMKRKEIYHQLTLDKDQFISYKAKGKSLKTEALTYRNSILESLRNKGFPKEEFSVLEALLLGRRQDISKEVVLNYQNAGAMHLLAISGLHIGILLMILNTLLRPMERLRHGKKIKLFVLIVFLWFFAFLSGLSASVIRAVFMFTILSIGLHSGRRNNLGHYLFTALFFSLIIHPGYLFDLGFQLSYAAVISIISLGPLIQSLWKPTHPILTYFWSLLAVSIAAQIGVLPLSLYYFHQFSALFFLSSLCVIPFLGIILGMGYFMLVLNQFDYLPEFYIKMYAWVIRMMNQVIEILASLDFLVFRRVFFTLILLLFSYMLIVFLISWMRNPSAKRTIATLLSMIIITTTIFVEKGLTQTGTSFVVFHLYKQSLVLNRFGGKGYVFESLSEQNTLKQRILNDYQLEHLTLKIEEANKMKHLFRIGDQRIMVIDHPNVKSDYGFKPDILILMNSPKINMDRLLKRMQPKIIVADGSNFSTYKSLWRRTAEKAKIIFYDTAKKGAFTLG
jgi:competence protein ComEC